MMRELLKRKYVGMNREFRFRGEEPGRLENFSDAVFALAITLLLISTTPPSNFEQIKRFVLDLVPFTLCITLILLIWHAHFVFFFRYGLRNGKVIFLNTLFLVIVLFYVYPLKFLTRLVLIPIARLTGNHDLLNEFFGIIRPQDFGDLMIIYGIGASGVFFVLMLMYRYALKSAEELELNELEKFDTKTGIRVNLLMGTVPLVSVIMAIIFRGQLLAGPIAGFTYILYIPVMLMHGKKVNRDRVKLIGLVKEEDKSDLLSQGG
jgi:uncharacterized membrane protein